jgi:hypothetical protein
MENTVFWCQECVFTGPLLSGYPVVELLCCGNVLNDPLPSNGYTHHNMATMTYVKRMDYAVFSVVKYGHHETTIILFIYLYMLYILMLAYNRQSLLATALLNE